MTAHPARGQIAFTHADAPENRRGVLMSLDSDGGRLFIENRAFGEKTG
jgi:hypothetical protein